MHAVSQEVLDIDGGEDRFLRALCGQPAGKGRGCKTGSVMCIGR